jgi:hypothetical protein
VWLVCVEREEKYIYPTSLIYKKKQKQKQVITMLSVYPAHQQLLNDNKSL